MALIAIKQNPPDFERAVPWLEEAARLENPDAQYYLGLLYLKGAGVRKNKNLADHWLQKAAQQGHKEATRVIVTRNVPKSRQPVYKVPEEQEWKPWVTASEGAQTETAILVMKGRSGICHGPHSRYYSRTKNYTRYSSIEACLESGGRLPKN